LWIFSNSIGAKVLLPEILSDNMVLQQNTKVKLWGKSDLGKTVEIRPSWTAEITKVKVDSKGNWIGICCYTCSKFYSLFHLDFRRRKSNAEQRVDRRGMACFRTEQHGDAIERFLEQSDSQG
jgi:glutamine amidotransferase-like uncharacterized protein